jgi:serine phosphatase RsbU (regulator of sigma subunit)
MAIFYTKFTVFSFLKIGVFCLLSFVSFSAENNEVKAEMKIQDLQERIDNFQKLSPKEKQATLQDQNDLVEEQLTDLNKQEKKLRRQRNRMIIQSGDIAKQERDLTSLFQQMGWQKTFMILLGLVLLLGLGVGWFAYRAYHQKQHFLEQEQYQKRLISEQNKILENQKERIETILQDVRDSIKYGLRIQNAVLPSGKQMAAKLPGDYFIFSKPKDIVSGDFYFVESQGDWTLAAVADCTGHGVPGAFVSLLCISLLNETINSKGDLKANEILQILRNQIITLLQQKEGFGESQDGMDISLALINKNKKEVQWAGANNPLLRYSSKEKTLLEYRPDKQPIGIYPKMSDFTNHSIHLDSGDILYLFSDGYSDQFGGPKGKKFMKRQLKKLLLDNAPEKMTVQHEILTAKLDTWMFDFDEKQNQVDDITILGVKID